MKKDTTHYRETREAERLAIEAEREAREALTCGDTVLVKIADNEPGSRSAPREFTVTRTTPTRIVVAGHSYLKKDGWAYGLRGQQASRMLWLPGGANHRQFLEQEARAVESARRQQKIRELVDRFRSLACLPDADLVKLNTLLEEVTR